MLPTDQLPQEPDLGSVPRRRLLGSYYTPDELATVLVRWALADGDGPVLDPSYGGCAFLEAAARVLSRSDPSNAGTGVYGVDIDPSCIETARDSELLIEANCIEADFLATSFGDLPGSPYAAIVGNPPYVRHHWITGDQQESARAVAAESSVPLPATASLWAYFLLHSLRFLATGGRLAMLVPEAILQTDYAAPLREMLAERFGTSRLIHIRDRQFEGTDEAVVALACSGFGDSGTVETLAVDSVEGLESVLLNSNGCPPDCSSFPPTDGDTLDAAIDLLSRIRESPQVRRLDQVASVRVGVVTGANRHFIRSRAALDAINIPADVRHGIVSRTRWLEGLEFTNDDHGALVAAGAAALLVRPESAEHDRLVDSWIQEGVEGGIDDRYKCALRSHWFRVDLPSRSDAFATCARAGSPLLVLNRGECLNSNALHSVCWESELAVTPEAVAVGFLTSAVSAWAELRGRRYGGGILKMEPGTLKRIPVPLIPGAKDVFQKLNRLLREGSEEEAREIADERVLGEGLRLKDPEIEILNQLRNDLTQWRRPSRAADSNG
ncbi:MAG: N-6 DNA methylase [Gemmatimonadota bacterium]|nr:N-6 DNA methylase [Gemmatimonadota bacterium]